MGNHLRLLRMTTTHQAHTAPPGWWGTSIYVQGRGKREFHICKLCREKFNQEEARMAPKKKEEAP